MVTLIFQRLICGRIVLIMWIMVFCECVRMHMFTKPTWEIRDIGKEERKIVDPGVL